MTYGVSSALSRWFADYTTEWIPGPMGVYRYLCSETSPKETYRELRVSPATIRQCIPVPPVFPLLHKPPRSPRIFCPRNSTASVRSCARKYLSSRRCPARDPSGVGNEIQNDWIGGPDVCVGREPHNCVCRCAGEESGPQRMLRRNAPSHLLAGGCLDVRQPFYRSGRCVQVLKCLSL